MADAELTRGAHCPRKVDRRQRPWGICALVGFFSFGVLMCSLTLFLLLFPGTPLDAAWRLKPEAQHELAYRRSWTLPMMAITAAACGLAAIGLARGNAWGRRMAIAVVIVNAAGDLSNAIFRSDWRTLIGLPIGGLLVFYLTRPHTIRYFRDGNRAEC